MKLTLILSSLPCNSVAQTSLLGREKRRCSLQLRSGRGGPAWLCQPQIKTRFMLSSIGSGCLCYSSAYQLPLNLTTKQTSRNLSKVTVALDAMMEIVRESARPERHRRPLDQTGAH